MFDVKNIPVWMKPVWPMAKLYLKGMKIKFDHSAKTVTFSNAKQTQVIQTDEIEKFVNGIT